MVEGVTTGEVAVFVGDFGHELKYFESGGWVLGGVVDEGGDEVVPVVGELDCGEWDDGGEDGLLDLVGEGQEGKQCIGLDILNDPVVGVALKLL